MKKHFLPKIIAALTVILPMQPASAASLKVEGGFVTLQNDRSIHLIQESGRYSNIGRNYYRTARIGCTSIKNTSTKRSGQLSLEYWALQYIDSENGTPLMSALIPPISSGKSVNNFKKEALAGYFGAAGYIQLRLYELVGGQWKLQVKRNIGSRQTL